MKIVTIIFSFYIFSICLLPCNDSYNEYSSSLSQTETNQEASHNDLCAPFCICSCCSIVTNSTFQGLKINHTKTVFELTQKLPIKDLNFISSYYGNIWPPPPKFNI